MSLELLGDLGLHLLVTGLGVVGLGEAKVDRLGDVTGTEVGRQHDDGVLEVHHTTLGVGETSLVEDLQQGVEDVGVGLFDLVEEDDAEWLAAHLLGELAALLITDESRRGTEHPGCGVLLGVLAHVQGDEGILVTEEELGERLGELGLADTGRAGENERTSRTLRILEAGAGTTDGATQRLDSVLLSDVTLADLVLHVKQSLGLLLGELEDRDAGGSGEHLGDLVRTDDGRNRLVSLLPLLLLGLTLGE